MGSEAIVGARNWWEFVPGMEVYETEKTRGRVEWAEMILNWDIKIVKSDQVLFPETSSVLNNFPFPVIRAIPEREIDENPQVKTRLEEVLLRVIFGGDKKEKMEVLTDGCRYHECEVGERVDRVVKDLKGDCKAVILFSGEAYKGRPLFEIFYLQPIRD